jgi:hypothetical protein
MADRQNENPITGLEALRAPARSAAQREAARARILAAADPLLESRRRPSSSWDVLAAWARPGLIAASLAFLVLAGALRLAQRPAPSPVALDDVLASGDNGAAVPALLVAMNEPDADAVAAALLGQNGAASPPQDVAPPEEKR